jgi:UrcA family protein
MTKYLTNSGAKIAMLAVGLLAGGALFMPHHASAAQDEEITVMAPRGVYRQQVGRSPTGVPIEEISLSRRVSYYGLDLRRPSDMNEMERRVRLTANEACDQITKLYPVDNFSTSDAECKSQAFKNGMDQVHMVAGR